MIQFAILVKRTTLTVLNEHAVNELHGFIPINETEALVMFSAETISKLIKLAKPEDERIDDVIVRLAL